MFNKLRRKFSLFAILSVFTFLTAILLTINIVNFSSVSSDAENITKNIMMHNGHYIQEPAPKNSPTLMMNTNPHNPAPGEGGKEGPMGPDSPEMKDSLRYFTISYDNNNEPTFVEYKINALAQDEALLLADSIKGIDKGQTRKVYYFRTWLSEDKMTLYVTVIDQSRELKPCYTCLTASLIGGGVGLVVTILAIYVASKHFIKPLEEADNKQKRFIANASIALRTPISIMSFDNATLMKENGIKEPNKSIDLQLKKMLDLANDLNAFSLIASSKSVLETINLSNVSKEVINRFVGAFTSNHKTLNVNIENDIVYDADLGMIQKMLSEIIENSLKYSDSHAEVSISKQNDRIVLEFRNDCEGLPEGSLDRVFDRFYRLDFKDHSKYDGSGIGLAIVKDIVNKHNGRAIAKGENGVFVLKIEL